MAVGLGPLATLLPVAGIRVGTARAGVKVQDRRDLVIFEASKGTIGAAVFTKNLFCAAPVHVARNHLAAAAPRYLIINTGYANAGTGEQGMADALAVCAAVAKQTDAQAETVLPFSTGVIGEPLPVARIAAGVPKALVALSADGWSEAAHGIMTTDTLPKATSRQVKLNGATATVTGIAKGSGMICPNMATMLAFVATDAAIAPNVLQSMLKDVTDQSFNCITVDGDTSTNDACVLLATGQAGNSLIASHDDASYATLRQAVFEVCEFLAQAIVRDGEGATKFMTVSVSGGKTRAECQQVAQTVANSPLVKTAFFASDPNWGRILAAVGRAGVTELAIDRVTVFLDDVCIVRNGARAADYTEQAGRKIMAQAEITIHIDIARGQHKDHVWTCDFSYDYVKINAEYRS